MRISDWSSDVCSSDLLHLALARQAGGHHVLGHVAGRVGGRTVDLGRVFARERAAAVRAGATVGIDDDLAAGEAAIALRAADDEAAGGAHQELGLGRDQAFGEAGLVDVFDYGLVDGRWRPEK